MATPLPMNRPVPIAPPKPIITSCALLKSLCSPASRLAIADASTLRTFGYDCSGFDLNLRLGFHEGNDLDDTHHGEVLAHHRAVRCADGRELCVIFVAARDVPSQAYDVFRA